MDDLSVRLRAGRTYDPSDNTIHKSEFLNIWNTAGRYPPADDVVMSSFPGYRVPVYKCLKLLETQFSHSAMYNHESSLTSFDDGLPQPDPYPSHRMEMSSPPMMGRSRNPSHTHRENLHPKYYESAFSDGDSQDAHHTQQPRSKLSSRSKDKERKQRVDTSVEDMRYPYSFTLHPPVRSGRVEPTNYRHVPQSKHKTYSAGPRSRHDDSDEEDFHPPPVMLPSHVNPSSSRRSCKQCRKHQAQLVDMQKEHEQVLSDLTDYRRELAKKNEKVQELKHEVEWLRRYGKVDSESLSDHVISDYQYERMKKHYEDKISRLERALQEMGKDCQYLREDWYRQKHKMRELETHLYQKEMELQQSEVERLASYRYHQAPWTPAVAAAPSGGKRYTHGRSRSSKQKHMQQEPEHAQLTVGVVSMSRTRSDGMVADVSGGESHGDPIKEQDLLDQQHRAKSLKSLQSEDSEGLHFVPTAEELKNTFKVLGEDVSKAVFPESLPEAMKLALMRALGNSHSQEDLVRTLFSYGCVPQSAEQYQELEKEYFCMKEAHEHLKVKHTTLHQTYRELKDFADSLYEQSNKHMSNEIALKVSLQYCHRVFEMVELANELSSTPLSRGTTALSPHFTFDSARPPHTYTSRVRQYLHDLDHDQPFQEFVSSSSSEELLSSLSLDLSQNTTSGISSATSSSIEGELTAEEMDRLKRYTRYAFAYQKRISQTVQCLGAMEGREVMTKYEAGLDGPVSGTSRVVDIENAVHMEELYAIREEKAELRSRIYMLEQEKKQADLEISRKELEFHQQKKMIQQLEQRLTDERKRKRRGGRKEEGGALYPEMEEDMYESLQLQYEELYMFLKENSRKSKDNHEKCMEFIKTLHQANHALVDAYEKSMKQQRMDKKQMREELKTQLARARAPEEAACHVGETRL